MTKWRGSKSERTDTAVNISKRVHRRLKIASAILMIAQKELVEAAIEEYMERRAGLDKILKEEEE